jgi:hypothetical protein
MKAQILTATVLTTATMLTAFSGPLSAADPILLNLVMPDATVVAGVNVQQAEGTQFGQFVLNQLQTQNTDMQKLVTLTGFDPRKDVRELLVATNGGPQSAIGQSKIGLALARGTFDVTTITAAATAAGVLSESYKGFTILEDPKQKQAGMVFLDGTTVVAGDVASVKAAIDRQKLAQPLPAALLVQINQWSTSQDAWAITTVPPTSLAPAGAVTKPNPMQNVAQNVLSAAGGVKFGTLVVFTGQATCDTAQNASTLGDMVKLLINIAQMQQTNPDPNAAALIKSVTVTPSGNVLNVSASLPEDVFQQALQPAAKAHMTQRAPHKK